VSNQGINSGPNRQRKEGQAETHLIAKKYSLKTCIPHSETLIQGGPNLRKKEASKKRPANITRRTVEVSFHAREATRKETGETEADTRPNVEIEADKT
jgi:hypothetical protein